MTLNAKNSHLSLTKGSITFSLLVWLYTKYTCFLCDFLSSLQLVAANIANITILQYCKATPALSSFYAGFPPRPLLITSYYSETAICKKHVNFTLVLCDVQMKTRENNQQLLDFMCLCEIIILKCFIMPSFSKAALWSLQQWRSLHLANNVTSLAANFTNGMMITRIKASFVRQHHFVKNRIFLLTSQL